MSDHVNETADERDDLPEPSSGMAAAGLGMAGMGPSGLGAAGLAAPALVNPGDLVDAEGEGAVTELAEEDGVEADRARAEEQGEVDSGA